MFLFITVFGLFIGPSAEVKQQSACYGGSLIIPTEYTPPHFSGKLYFSPTKGRQRVLIENRQAKDPRMKIGYSSAVLKDLSKKDEGTFSVSLDGESHRYEIFRLKVNDCAEEITRYYGSGIVWFFPEQAEYIEFMKLGREDLIQVVWNRSDPQILLDSTRRGSWEIDSVTQADSGVYNLRRKDASLLRRKRLTVVGYIQNYNENVNEQLVVGYPVAFSLGKVTFTPKGTSEPETISEKKNNQDYWISEQFEMRVESTYRNFKINDLEISDSGTYKFLDPNGNEVLTVNLEVNKVIPPSVLVGVTLGSIFLVIICCFCMRKRCCKKSSSKRSQSAPQSAAASATNYYDNSQPAVVPYSALPSTPSRYQPVNPHVSVQPTTTFHGPQAAAIGGQEGATVIGGQGVAVAAPSLNTDFSSDPAPTFQLKGLDFLSASPLSSDSTSTDVYHSEKLHFL